MSLYVWDAQQEKNLLKTEERIYLIDAHKSIEIPYEVIDTLHSVYFLQATAHYQDTKSEVAVRFGRQ